MGSRTIYYTQYDPQSVIKLIEIRTLISLERRLSGIADRQREIGPSALAPIISIKRPLIVLLVPHYYPIH